MRRSLKQILSCSRGLSASGDPTRIKGMLGIETVHARTGEPSIMAMIETMRISGLKQKRMRS